MGKSIVTVLLFVFALSFYGSCTKEKDITREGRTIKDMSGRSVTVPDRIKKIICLAPGTLRLIVYLQSHELLAGVEAFEKKMSRGRPYWLAAPELAKLPVVGPGGPGSINKNPDMEAVMRAKPDVIFTNLMSAEKAASLQARLHIPVVVISYGRNFGNWDRTIYDSLRCVGEVLGKKKRAEEVISFIEKTQNDIIRRGKSEKNTTPAYVGAIGFKGLQGIESTDAAYWPFTWTGIRNSVAGKKEGHLFINKEALLKMNPPVIFIDGGGLEIVRQDMNKKASFYRSLGAVKARRVYRLLPFNFYLTNIGTVLVDGYAVGKTMKKKAFGDIALSKKAGEIYTFLVGENVYPAMKKAYGDAGSFVSLEGK